MNSCHPLCAGGRLVIGGRARDLRGQAGLATAGPWGGGISVISTSGTRRHRSMYRLKGSRIRWIAPLAALTLGLAGAGLSGAAPASAASVMTVAVTSNPQPV